MGGDTIIGCGHKGAIVSRVERKISDTLLKKVVFKTKDRVSAAICQMPWPLAGNVKTITYDNGKELDGTSKSIRC